MKKFINTINIAQIISQVILLVTLIGSIYHAIVQSNLTLSWSIVGLPLLIIINTIILSTSLFVEQKSLMVTSAAISLVVAMLTVNISSILMLHSVGFAIIGTVTALEIVI